MIKIEKSCGDNPKPDDLVRITIGSDLYVVTFADWSRALANAKRFTPPPCLAHEVAAA